MYCSKCGAKIEGNSSFCAVCGAPVDTPDKAVAKQEPMAQNEPTAVQQSQVQSYYEKEFFKLAAGEKSRFNWAAFFFGPFHQLYHKSKDLFKKTFLPCMITAAVLNLIGTVASVMMLKTFSMGAIAVVGISGLLNSAVSVWALVLLVLYGKSCNKKLFEQVNGQAEQIPKNKKAPVLLAALMAVWAVILLVVPVIGSGAAEEDEWLNEIPISNAENGQAEVQTEGIRDLSQLTQVPQEDLYLYTQLAFTQDIMEGDDFGSLVLYGDTTVDLDTLFGSLFDAYEWDDTIMQEYTAQGTFWDAVCHWKEDQLRLRLFSVYDQVSIEEAVLQKADGSVQTLTQQETADLMAAMCAAYHAQTGTQQASPVFSILGKWYNQEENFELEVTRNTIGNTTYQVRTIRPNSIRIYADQPDGTSQAMELVVNGMILEIHIIEEYGYSDPYGLGEEIALSCFERIE